MVDTEEFHAVVPAKPARVKVHPVEFLYRVAAKINAGEKQVKEISMAKNFSCMVSDRVTDDASQILGRCGYLRRYLVERLCRDNRILSIGGGTREIMKEIIAKHISS